MQQFIRRKRHVRRPVGKQFYEKYIAATMKRSPSQMVWDAMSSLGPSGLYCIPPDTTTNEPRDAESLKEKLTLQRNSHKCTLFMTNGAPCHRSKIVTDFLKNNKITVLELPGNSPDVNPTEDMWLKC